MLDIGEAVKAATFTRDELLRAMNAGMALLMMQADAIARRSHEFGGEWERFCVGGSEGRGFGDGIQELASQLAEDLHPAWNIFGQELEKVLRRVSAMAGNVRVAARSSRAEAIRLNYYHQIASSSPDEMLGSLISALGLTSAMLTNLGGDLDRGDLNACCLARRVIEQLSGAWDCARKKRKDLIEVAVALDLFEEERRAA